MRKSLKKLLSFVLVIGIMAGSFIFAMPALADSGVVLETNGGTLASTAPIEAGALLPNYEGITRDGCTFGGWFLNADLTGAQQFTAAANTTYYARWVDYNINVTGFEDATDVTTKFTTYGGNNYKAEINTNAANAYEGSKSLMLKENGNNTFAGGANSIGVGMLYKEGGYPLWDNVANIEEGYAFWISTDKEVTIVLTTYYWNTVAREVTVPAGKHIITFSGTSAFVHGRLATKGANHRTIYIDAIGTYTTVPYTPPVVEVPAAYETNGGTFNAGYTIPTAAGATLPTYENITREGCVFGGWHTEADFSDPQQFVIENDTKYYARWIDHDVTVTDFEDYSTDGSTEKIFKSIHGDTSSTFRYYRQRGTDRAALNTDSQNAYSGNKSAKLTVPNGGSDNQALDFGTATDVDGWYSAANMADKDGFSFWISTKETVKFRFATNWGWSFVEFVIPKGQHIISIPKNKLSSFNIQTKFVFYCTDLSNGDTEVFIDDIGSYTVVPYVAPTPVTLNTNGGTLADPDAEYFAQDTLPTEITKANAIFAGWYDNAELTGTPVTVAQNNGVYYASWIEDIKVIDSFESGFAAPWKEFDISGNAITSLTVADGALKVVTKNICKEAVVGYSGDEFDAICYDKNLGTTITSEGIYAVVRTEYPAEIRFTINPNDNSTWGTKDRNFKTETLNPGTHYIKLPWSAFSGEAFGHDDVSKLGFSIKGIWSRNASLIGTLYIEEFGVYGVEVKPSYGIATPGAAGLFSAVQSENSGIVITPGHAVYEVGGTKYTAFRVFGTYVAPDKNGAPDFGKVVVGEGDVREIASRHVMLGYKTEPTLEKNYVMTNAKGDFDKCWSFEQNPDGTWKVTYSLLLKDIPEDYAATAFNVKSAIVTKDNTTIYSGEMVEGVSAQAIFDKIEGDKPVWFFN